jgi:[acyl-carrier-protein] S-malonyltransferase
MKIGFLFAGQGAQAKGMGQDFYNNLEVVKNIYDKFPEIRDLCFFDEKEVINQTMYAQPAMLLTSYAIASALKEKGITPEYACGLSLGEYSALAFANAWSIEDAISIISRRGEIMQNALPLGTTKMAAVIGLDRETILNTIKEVSGVCEIANYNCPGQIVITGDNEGVDNAMPKLSEAGARRVIPLNVSGAFHSSLLRDASKELRLKLDQYKPNKPNCKIVYNVSGKEETRDLNSILEDQICHSVYFEDSIRYMIDHGVDTFIEVGPGRTLTGFLRKIDSKLKCYTVTDYESYNLLLNELGK